MAFANSEADAVFARARNAEIDASMAKVGLVRSQEYGEEMSARVDADFALARNAEIAASLAAVANARREEALEMAFEKARNAEINASIAAVAEAKKSEFKAISRAESGLTTGSIDEAQVVPFVTTVIYQLGL
jgi:hypothetical protein